MKRDKNFYCVFIMICFVVVYVTSFILTGRTIEAGKLMATASIIIYPITYFLGTVFAERYGKDKFFNLMMYSIVSLLLCALLVTCSSFLPICNGSDGLDKIFNVDYRIVFSFITAFLVGQIVNITIYQFLDKKKSFNFLISSVIAITVDSLIFVTLAYVGTMNFKDLVQLFSGQYVLSVIAMIIYALCFAYIIGAVVKTKKKNEDMENVILERTSSIKAVNMSQDKEEALEVKPKKTATKKAAVRKTTDAKKTTTTKKTATKKTTTKTTKKA